MEKKGNITQRLVHETNIQKFVLHSYTYGEKNKIPFEEKSY